MKWLALALFAALAALPVAASAQVVLPVGHIAQVDDRSPTTWGMSGMEILRITQSDGNFTPIMRTETFDARTVEILSRTEAPPLRARDINITTRGNRYFITVRRYLLLEVRPQDARAAGVSQRALAHTWLASIRRVLPQVAPLPSRFGV